jgi:hypothetical protein
VASVEVSTLHFGSAAQIAEAEREKYIYIYGSFRIRGRRIVTNFKKIPTSRVDYEDGGSMFPPNGRSNERIGANLISGNGYPNIGGSVGSEVFTPVTMKNAVFWDMRTQFVPHGSHITFPLQSPVGYCYVGFEVFMAVNIKNAVFWDVALCGSCKNRPFGGRHRLHHQGEKSR